MTNSKIQTRLLSGFHDPSFSPADWGQLLATGASDVVFLTWHWQSAWWKTFRRGKLMLIVAERDGKSVALAPLFTEASMVYFVGSGGSDYLDFIGDISEPEVLDALLTEARRGVPNFIGFVFYHVPDQSESGARLRMAGERLGLKLVDEGEQFAPVLEISAHKEIAVAAANKKGLVRDEHFFSREGSFQIEHLSDGEKILPYFDAFFAQHVRRWAATPTPSLFCDEAQRQFYRLLTTTAAKAGWLRFTKLEWKGRVVAYHFGFNRRGTFLYYKPAYDVELARRSPGSVLLRQLLLAALAEGAHTFDFGLGDETYKSRFATKVNTVRNWGLYKLEAIKDKN